MKVLSSQLSNWFHYVAAHFEPRYRYVLEGEKGDGESDETVLLYRRSGKRQLIEATAQQICNEKELIQHFHPLDVRTICFIAGAELIQTEAENLRSEKLKGLKSRIFNEGLRL